MNKSFDCHKMPGLSIGTVGYHVDDGKIFEGGCSEVGREIEGMSYFDCRSRIYSNVYEGFVSLKSLLVLPLKQNEFAPTFTSSPLNLSTRFLTVEYILLLWGNHDTFRTMCNCFSMEKTRVRKLEKSQWNARRNDAEVRVSTYEIRMLVIALECVLPPKEAVLV